MSEKTLKIERMLPHVWYDGTGELPEDLINARIIRIGAITEGKNKGKFGLEYLPHGEPDKKLLVISYCDVCMYLEGATIKDAIRV